MGYVQFPPPAPGTIIHGLQSYFQQYSSFRFREPGSAEMGLQLLPSEEFAHFTISEKTTIRIGTRLYPKLPDFLEALIYQYTRPAQTEEEREYRCHICVHLFYLGEYSPIKHSILPDLSSRARQAWSDILNDEFVFGDAAVEHYGKLKGLESQNDIKV
jgi:hypothetical protein